MLGLNALRYVFGIVESPSAPSSVIQADSLPRADICWCDSGGSKWQKAVPRPGWGSTSETEKPTTFWPLGQQLVLPTTLLSCTVHTASTSHKSYHEVLLLSSAWFRLLCHQVSPIFPFFLISVAQERKAKSSKSQSRSSYLCRPAANTQVSDYPQPVSITLRRHSNYCPACNN